MLLSPGVVLNLVKAQSGCCLHALNNMLRWSCKSMSIKVLSSACASGTLYCNLSTQRQYTKSTAHVY